MAYLTKKYIRAGAAKDPRIESIEWDEQGKALIWLADGYTWDKNDGNRTVEGFIFSEHNGDEASRDTVSYWRDCLANIESTNT